jgi:hypothetical protein
MHRGTGHVIELETKVGEGQGDVRVDKSAGVEGHHFFPVNRKK